MRFNLRIPAVYLLCGAIVLFIMLCSIFGGREAFLDLKSGVLCAKTAFFTDNSAPLCFAFSFACVSVFYISGSSAPGVFALPFTMTVFFSARAFIITGVMEHGAGSFALAVLIDIAFYGVISAICTHSAASSFIKLCAAVSRERGVIDIPKSRALLVLEITALALCAVDALVWKRCNNILSLS